MRNFAGLVHVGTGGFSVWGGLIDGAGRMIRILSGISWVKEDRHDRPLLVVGCSQPARPAYGPQPSSFHCVSSSVRSARSDLHCRNCVSRQFACVWGLATPSAPFHAGGPLSSGDACSSQTSRNRSMDRSENDPRPSVPSVVGRFGLVGATNVRRNGGEPVRRDRTPK